MRNLGFEIHFQACLASYDFKDSHEHAINIVMLFCSRLYAYLLNFFT